MTPGQTSLFGSDGAYTEAHEITHAIIEDIVERIPGLRYNAEYISEQEEQEYINWVDEQAWITDLKRRVQHYGWRYDYRARKVDDAMWLGDLPDTLANVARRLHDDGLIPAVPDQVIINEYQPGQGIGKHIDCEPCFGDTIITISLGSDCIMEFTKAQRSGARMDIKRHTDEVVPVMLARRSAVTLHGDSRWWWFHGIQPHKTDTWNGIKFYRSRRISLTFRKVIIA